jgi:hypothetical protein
LIFFYITGIIIIESNRLHLKVENSELINVYEATRGSGQHSVEK